MVMCQNWRLKVRFSFQRLLFYKAKVNKKPTTDDLWGRDLYFILLAQCISPPPSRQLVDERFDVLVLRTKVMFPHPTVASSIKTSTNFCWEKGFAFNGGDAHCLL